MDICCIFFSKNFVIFSILRYYNKVIFSDLNNEIKQTVLISTIDDRV